MNTHHKSGVRNPMDVITPLLDERVGLSGVICEFGVFRGETTRLLARFRQTWAFDTFEGLPGGAHTASLDTNDAVGAFVPRSKDIAALWRTRNVVMVRGLFADTLRHLELPVVLAYLDCDYYLSAVQALTWLDRNVVRGGAIVLDDYSSHAGIRKAVDSFRGWRFDRTLEVLHRDPCPIGTF